MLTNGLYPFMERNTILDDTDLDSLKVSGVYNMRNIPEDNPCPVKYGNMVIYKSWGQTSQTVFDYKNGSVYSRANWNDEGWSVWKRLDNFGYNTINELSTGVAGLIGFSQTLRFVGDITTGNANELGSGIYFYDVNIGSLTNNPGGNFGFIICIANTTMKLQIGGWGGGDSGLKCRNWYSGGIWSTWRDL